MEKSEFEELCKDLDLLKKSQSYEDDGDKKIKAASEEDEEGSDDNVNKKMTDTEDNEDEKDTEDQFGKSLPVILPSGEQAMAVDAGQLIKSLQDGIDRLGKGLETDRESFAKSLNVLTEKMEEQGKVIKAIGEQVIRMAKSGSGRKSVMNPPATELGKSQQQQLSPESLLQKCESAMEKGRLSGMELTMAEICVNQGVPLPRDILSKLQFDN